MSPALRFLPQRPGVLTSWLGNAIIGVQVGGRGPGRGPAGRGPGRAVLKLSRCVCVSTSSNPFSCFST